MATQQAVRPQEKNDQWSALFPVEQTVTQSFTFVRKLLAIAISNITYLRGIFPEKAYADRSLEDLSIKILKDDGSVPGALQIVRWIKGSFDAIEKKYLKMLMIGIYVDAERPDDVIESYTFKFSYAQQPSMDIYKNDQKVGNTDGLTETKKETVRLLRTLVILSQSLHSLPDEVLVTMKLLYYDDVTPADYEPPGFIEANADGFGFDVEPMSIKIGDVSTPFHTLKVRLKADASQFDYLDQDVKENMENKHEQESKPNKEVETSEKSKHEDIEDKCEDLVTHTEPAEGDSVPHGFTPAKPDKTGEAVEQSLGSAIETSQDEYVVRCPCGCNEDDGVMILCANCKLWQHAVCFGITGEEVAPQYHICDSCADMNDEKLYPTDVHLHGLTEVAIQATCLWRRALLATKDMSRVLAVNMSKRLGIETTVAQGLVNRLEKEGYIKAPGRGKRLGKIVNKAALAEGIKKYFVLNEEADEEDPISPTISKSPSVQPVENDVESSQKSTSKRKRSPEQIEVDQIDALSSQAEDICLSSRLLNNQNEMTKKEVNRKMKGKTFELDDSLAVEKKRGQKRVKITEECDEDRDNQYNCDKTRSGRKRVKASQVEKAIVV